MTAASPRIEDGVGRLPLEGRCRANVQGPKTHQTATRPEMGSRSPMHSATWNPRTAAITTPASSRGDPALLERGELSKLVDMVPSQVWRLAPDGEPTFFNKRVVDYLGLEVADLSKPGF